MDNIDLFNSFFSSSDEQISAYKFILNLILAGILSIILGFIYQKYGYALSNRKIFSRNFILLTLITVLVITVIKSSLALSLGLVGALSIVRFRGAIKEPEELSYLFFSIGIGLGIGANLIVTTLLAFVIICTFIIILRRFDSNTEQYNLFLTVSSENNIKSSDIISCLAKHFISLNLKRIDETKNYLEMSFMVQFAEFEKLENVKSELFKIDKSLKFNFIDNKGIM